MRHGDPGKIDLKKVEVFRIWGPITKNEIKKNFDGEFVVTSTTFTEASLALKWVIEDKVKKTT